MSLVKLEANELAVQSALAAKVRSLQRPRPLLLAIGEHLAETTRMRFVESRAPDGSRWASNSQTTMERYIGERGGYSKKTGRIISRGAALAQNKKPLVGTTRQLGSQILYQATDAVLQVGSNRIQAAVMQHGADKGSLGGGAPWGDIPARPYLGLSAGDRSAIVEMIAGYLE